MVNRVIWGLVSCRRPGVACSQACSRLCLRAAADQKLREPRKESIRGDVRDDLCEGLWGHRKLYNRTLEVEGLKRTRKSADSV